MDITQNQTFLTEGKPPPEELAEDDLGDLQALVSGVTQTSQSTLLLKKRKQMREVDDALEFMNEEYKARVAECERGQLEFERKQVDMKKMVAQFQQFITENDAKQRRAEIKAKTEAEQREKLEEEIKKLKIEEQELQARTAQLNVQLESVRKYEKYLNDVVESANDEYEEISEVVNRHATLQQANDDLTEQSDTNNGDIEKKRLALVQLRQDQQNRILVMNGQVQSSQKLIESLRAECSTLDIEKESKERFTKDRTIEYGAVVMSIKNLYQRCQSSYRDNTKKGTHAGVKDKGNVLKYLTVCLDAMGRRIQDLIDTNGGYAEWKAAGGVVEEVGRDTRTPVPNRPRGNKGGGKGGRGLQRGRGSTTSSASINSRGLPRVGSNASGFRNQDSSMSHGGRKRSTRRRGSDASSNFG